MNCSIPVKEEVKESMSEPEVAELSHRYEELGEAVIGEHPELAFIHHYQVKIGYMVSNKKKKSSGRAVFADCRKVQDYYKAEFIPYDFLITVYTENCEAAAFTDEEYRILMFHELMHVIADMNDKGEIRFSVAPHDIEDFAVILKQYGLGWQLKGLLARKQAEAQSIKGGAFVNELFDSGAGEEDEETETYEAEE